MAGGDGRIFFIWNIQNSMTADWMSLQKLYKFWGLTGYSKYLCFKKLSFLIVKIIKKIDNNDIRYLKKSTMVGELFGTGKMLIPHKTNAVILTSGIWAFIIITAKSMIMKINIIKLQRFAYTQKLL